MNKSVSVSDDLIGRPAQTLACFSGHALYQISIHQINIHQISIHRRHLSCSPFGFHCSSSHARDCFARGLTKTSHNHRNHPIRHQTSDIESSTSGGKTLVVALVAASKQRWRWQGIGFFPQIEGLPLLLMQQYCIDTAFRPTNPSTNPCLHQAPMMGGPHHHLTHPSTPPTLFPPTTLLPPRCV